MHYDINALLTEAVKKNASDIHINADRPPQYRIDGKLVPAGDQPLTHSGE